MSDVKVMALPVEKFNEAADVTEKVFKDTFMRDIVSKDDSFNYKNVRVLLEDNKIVTVVVITPKQMYIDSLIFDMCGIGGVSSLPEVRGKGYAGMVMKDAVKKMKNIGCDISLLYPFKPSYYAKFGFRIINFPYKVLHKKDIKIELPSDINIRKFKKSDINDISEIYNIFNKNRTGTLIRDLEYWQLKIDQLKVLNGEIFVAEKEGKIKAYVIVTDMKKDWDVKEHQNKIIEVGAYPEYMEIISPMVHYVSLKRLGEQYDRIFYDDIDGIEIKGGKELDEEDKKFYQNLKDIKMLMIPHHESFMSKITVLFNKRLKLNGYKVNSWQDLLSIEFESNDDMNSTVLIKYKDEILNIDEGVFLNMIFGNLKLYYNDFKISTDFKNILKVLFPEIKPVYWDFDFL